MNKAQNAAAPHQWRAVGGKVLITDENGRWALITKAEHSKLLAGPKPSDALFRRLQPLGFIAGAYDFDGAARRRFERSLLSWKGPAAHVVLVDGMSLETAKRVADFVFRCPGPQLTLEFVVDDAVAAWPVIWFLVQYARRRGEWARRPVFLVARAKTMTPDQADFLRSHGVARGADLVLDGSPDMKKAPPFRAQRARAVLSPGVRDPRAWALWFETWGFESVKLLPPSYDAAAVAPFLDFYGDWLGWLVENGERANLRDEWAAALLAGRPWALPGMDVLEQLAYDSSGRIFTSEAAVGSAGLQLGEAGELRYQDIAGRAATAGVIAAAHADNQPLCSQCAYRPFCALPPSLNEREQGSLWGQTPSSPACAIQMGILDRIFERLNSENMLHLLTKWHVDMT